MNTPASPKKVLVARLLTAITATAGLLAPLSSASAATLYWDGPSASWATLGSWSTAFDNAAPDPGAVPGASDDVVFNITTYNTANLIGMGGAPRSVNAITFSSTGTVGLGNLGGNQDLTVGLGGITMTTGAGAATVGNASNGSNVFVRLGASQTWTNNSTASLTSRNSTSGLATGTVPVTLTLSATNTGTITNSGALNDGAAGAVVSLVVDSSGTGASSNAGGNYSGGTTILSGILSTSGTTPLGASSGAVLLGNTSGTALATLNINSTSTLANNITVRAGSSGVKTIGSSVNSVLGGAITLNDNLTFSPSSNTTTVNGVISGVGGVTKAGTGTLALAGNNTFSGGVTVSTNSTLRINNGGTSSTNSAIGTGTLNGTGSFTLDNTSGADVTLATNNAVILNGTLTFTGTNSLNIGTGAVLFGGTTRTINVSANNLTIGGVISATGSAGLTKQGNGTLTLTGLNNYTGTTQITGGSTGGVLEVTKLTNTGEASSIGAGTGALTFGGSSAGTLRYIGSGDSTNRTILIGGSSAIFDASGSGAIAWTSGSNVSYSTSNVNRVITFKGASTHGNLIATAFTNSGTGITSILKQETGRWILSGSNTYTGDTTIDAGTLELGASNRIGNSSNLVLNGGTFATGGFNETLGTLSVGGTVTIDFGSTDASHLVFADSSAAIWGTSVSLSIVNFNGLDSIQFGSDQNGLSMSQLGKITINGLAAAIDSQGFLSTIPEPSSFAALAGLSILGVSVGLRRRRTA